MKLRALKTLSNKRPKGAIFEESNPRAKMLVFIGAAEEVVDPPKPAAKPEPEPAPVAATRPTPAQSSANLTRAANAALRRQSNDR